MAEDTQSSPELKSYRVLSRLRYGGTYVKGDTVQLPEDVANRLLSLPHQVIEAIEPEDPAGHTEVAISNPEVQLTDEEPAEESEPVDINSASLDDLIRVFSKVSGIGRGSAQAVVDNRPYESLDEVPDKADLMGTARAKWPEVKPLLVCNPE